MTEHLKKKIATEEQAGFLDEESKCYLKDIITSPESSQYLQQLPSDSFQHVFWQQQVEAASQANSRSIRWHSLMVRWCLYLRHKSVYHYNHLLIIFFPRSGSAYEMLRESRRITLPSQRTLGNYTYFVESSFGFSGQIDQMIMDAAKITTCPE